MFREAQWAGNFAEAKQKISRNSYSGLFSCPLQTREQDADDTTGSVLLRAWFTRIHVVDTVPAVKVFKTDLYGRTLTK